MAPAAMHTKPIMSLLQWMMIIKSSKFIPFTPSVCLPADSTILGYSSTRDVLYIANVTVEGVEYPLQMDTGSSDLWLDMGDTVPDGQVCLGSRIPEAHR